jgi:hypothetical protein
VSIGFFSHLVAWEFFGYSFGILKRRIGMKR